MNQLIITNSYFIFNKEISDLKAKISIPDFNFINIKEKLEVESFIDRIETLPMLDNFKLIIFDISLYSLKELKEILKVMNRVGEVNQIVGVYYLKDKLDKLDSSISTLFKKYSFELKKLNKIDINLTKNMLKENNLNLNVELFRNHDDMDSIVNDISKISCLDRNSLTNDIAKKYLSESLDSNIFELIDVILKKDVDSSLFKLELLLTKESEYLINLLILKHFILLRLIKEGGTLNEVSKKEKFSGGKGFVNEYRFNLLKKSNYKINLNYAINELLNNDKNKSFNLEISLIKIFNQK